MTSYDVVIVGAGHAGAQVAIALRHLKYAGTVAIVGAEPDPPYERPPLSKEYLSGEKSFERLLLRPCEFWEERALTLLLGRRVVAIDPQRHAVTMDDGSQIGYRTLIWATGGAPRRLSCEGHDLAGVHTVRTRADVDLMIAELPQVKRVVVVGGGYIGLEAAAVLSKLGKHVVVVEALDRVLARVAGEPLSRFYESEHRAHGVEILLRTAVAAIVGENNHVTGVRLEGGKLLPAEMVVVGIGIVPTVEPLLAAGASGGNGVRVDAFCRTSLQDVFAIGDCALHRNSFAEDAEVRLESVQNASDMANAVAKTICGTPTAYEAVPWFWSNQYDLRLQTVGLSIGHDQVMVRGDQVNRTFSVIYLKEGRVIALDCVNAVKDYVQGRALVMARPVISAEALTDIARPLKALL